MKHFCQSLLFSIVLLIALPAAGQEKPEDTVSQKNAFFPKSYGSKKWKLVFGLDIRRSLFAEVPLNLYGLRSGAQFRGVHRFGIGVYSLPRTVYFSSIPLEHPASTDTSLVSFYVNYASLFYERVIYRTKRWEFAVPAEVSLGHATARYEDTTGTFIPLVDDRFVSLNMRFQAKYFIFPWIAPRVSIGYRLLFNTAPEVKEAFNRPYYSFGAHILLDELYQAIFKRNEENEF